MTDREALDHISQRLAVARDAEARCVTLQAIIDQTRAAFREAGVLSGTLPEMVRKLAAEVKAERRPPPSGSEWVGQHFYVDGLYWGYVARMAGGEWVAMSADRATHAPDERTARAVLMALASLDFGVTVALDLREGWTHDELARLQRTPLVPYISALIEAWMEGAPCPQHVEDVEVIRAWVAHGQDALTLRVVDADDVPL